VLGSGGAYTEAGADLTCRPGEAGTYCTWKPDSPWCPWLEPAIEQIEAAFAAEAQAEEDRRAAAEAQEAAARAAQEEVWAANPRVTFEELQGILGRPADDPAVVAVIQRRKHTTSFFGGTMWKYDDGYSIHEEDGVVSLIGIREPLPDLDLGQDEADVLARFGEPFRRDESIYGDMLIWDLGDSVLTVALKRDPPHAPDLTTLRTRAAGASFLAPDPPPSVAQATPEPEAEGGTEPISVEEWQSRREEDAAWRRAQAEEAVENGCRGGAVYAGWWKPYLNSDAVWTFEVEAPSLWDNDRLAERSMHYLIPFLTDDPTQDAHGDLGFLLIECGGHRVAETPDWCAQVPCLGFRRFDVD